MAPDRQRNFSLDLWGLTVVVFLIAVPFVTASPLLQSLTHQIVIGISATLGVYIMLRMGLIPFTVPAFMAVGGYAAAIAAKAGFTDLFLLMALSFIVPALVAIFLGGLILRLRGAYFIFVTYIFNEILQLLIFETPNLTGGPNGIEAVPPATLFGFELASSQMLLVVTITIGIVAALVSLAVTHRFRPEFVSIHENETLAQSLGIAVWKYRMIGFIASAGVSGLAGFALINMLSTAHPSSFSSFSAVNYIAYAFIGGQGSMLGVVVGSVLLIVMANLFSSHAELSSGLFGLLLIVVMMAAPGGVVGTVQRLFGFLNPRAKKEDVEAYVERKKA